MTGLYRTETEGLDECLRLMFPDLEADDFRTEGGNINMPKARSMWRERRDLRLMLQLSERFGVCVGKNAHGVAYVGYPGTIHDAILTYDEGTGLAAATAELVAVIRAIAKVTPAGSTSGGVPVTTARRATDSEIQAWADRHDLGISSIKELRCIFEDAESHHLTRGVTGGRHQSLPPAGTDGAQEPRK